MKIPKTMRSNWIYMTFQTKKGVSAMMRSQRKWAMYTQLRKNLTFLADKFLLPWDAGGDLINRPMLEPFYFSYLIPKGGFRVAKL